MVTHTDQSEECLQELNSRRRSQLRVKRPRGAPVDSGDRGGLQRGEVFWMLTKLYVRAMNEEGATAVEYGLMVALIAIVIIGAVIIVGQNLDGVFTAVGDNLTAVAP